MNQGSAVELAALAEQARHAEVRFQGLVVDLQAAAQGACTALSGSSLSRKFRPATYSWDSESMRRRWRRVRLSRRPRKKPVAMAKKNSGISQSGSARHERGPNRPRNSFQAEARDQPRQQAKRQQHN